MSSIKLVVFILKADAQCTGLLSGTRNTWCFHSVCSSRIVARTNGSRLLPIPTASSPTHRARHAQFSARRQLRVYREYKP